MSNKGCFTVLVILILVLYLFSDVNIKEKFLYPPLWNVPTRGWWNTRLQSYDLRGDVPVAYTGAGPWLQSPHVNYWPYGAGYGERYNRRYRRRYIWPRLWL